MATASALRRKPKSRVGTPGPHRKGGGRPPGDRLSKEHAQVMTPLGPVPGEPGLLRGGRPRKKPSSVSQLQGLNEVWDAAREQLLRDAVPNMAPEGSALSAFTGYEQLFIQLMAKGRDEVEAGAFLRLSPKEAKAIIKQPDYIEALAEAVQQVVANAIDLFAPLVPRAVQVISMHLAQGNLRAAEGVIDHAVGKAALMERKEIKQALLIRIEHIDAPNAD